MQALLANVITPLLRRLPTSDSWFARLFGAQGLPLYGRLHTWMIVGLSQGFAAMFLGGALLALLIKVTTTDLAFAWSTTLQLSPDQVHGAVNVALPWSWLLPSTVPTPEIIAASNYERYIGSFDGSTERTHIDDAIAATWWQFCALCTLVYGVAPRVAVLLLANWRWRRAPFCRRRTVPRCTICCNACRGSAVPAVPLRGVMMPEQLRGDAGDFR